MNLVEVKASPEEIAAKLESYREYTTAEDQRVLAAYCALEQGRILVDLPTCIVDSLSYNGLPKGEIDVR